MTSHSLSGNRFIPFTRLQVTILLIIGAVLWFIAAQILHWLGPLRAYEGSARIIMYVLIVPGTVPFLLISFKIAGVEKSKRLLACAVMLGSATLIDGVVLAWAPWIYGDTPELVAGAGGTVLWGVGVALMLGFFLNRTDED